MVRGVDGCRIFRSSSDFEDFLARFTLLVRELGFGVLAWCLLGNHAHFVLKTGARPLAELMARLTSRHAQRFNRANERRGHLFQDRYKAVQIDDEGKLARGAAYVLGNALRHRAVLPPAFADYPWSGYGLLAGRRAAFGFESIELMRAALGVEGRHADEFVREQALATAPAGAALEPDPLEELNRMIREACAARGVPIEALRSVRPASRPLRRELVARAVSCLDLPLKAIAGEVGLSYRAARKLSAKLRQSRTGAQGV
jgi:REP element-mobilizing transposase RayT